MFEMKPEIFFVSFLSLSDKKQPIEQRSLQSHIVATYPFSFRYENKMEISVNIMGITSGEHSRNFSLMLSIWNILVKDEIKSFEFIRMITIFPDLYSNFEEFFKFVIYVLEVLWMAISNFK